MRDRVPHSASRSWPWLVLAAISETGWIAGIKPANTLPGIVATGAAVALSLALALRATRAMRATTVYILFAGLGTLGAFVLDLLIGDIDVSIINLCWLIALVTSTFGLQYSAGKP